MATRVRPFGLARSLSLQNGWQIRAWLYFWAAVAFRVDVLEPATHNVQRCLMSEIKKFLRRDILSLTSLRFFVSKSLYRNILVQYVARKRFSNQVVVQSFHTKLNSDFTTWQLGTWSMTRIMDLQNYNYEQIYFYGTMEHGFSYIWTSAGTGSINKK